MSTELRIVEGVESTWHYHLKREFERAALCGNSRVMNTLLPLAFWNDKRPSHIPQSFCKRCDEVRNP